MPAWSPDGTATAYITGTPIGDIAWQTVAVLDLATGLRDAPASRPDAVIRRL